MKYRALAAVLGTAAILSAGAASAEAPYTDLNTLPQRAAVDYLYDTQCLTFVTGDQFHPNTVLTRGDLAQLIYNAAANMPLANPEFKDVQPGRAADAMAAVAAQGILTGYEDGSFQPDKEVTREEFAGVLYRYLQYCRLADADGEVEAYADEGDVSPAELTAVQVLHSKNIMVPEDNRFRPKDGITRMEAAEVIYHLLHSDEDYVSHVQVEMQVMKCLNAEYGSAVAYFRYGTMYWEGNTLVLGIKGSPGRYLEDRIEHEVTRADAVSIRRVRLSRSDYDRILNSAVNTIVRMEGVQTYVGSIPDYVNEQVVVTVRRPVSEQTLKALTERVGAGVIRIETLAAPGKAVHVQENRSGDGEGYDVDRRGRRHDNISYSPLVDQATSNAIAYVENDVMN